MNNTFSSTNAYMLMYRQIDKRRNKGKNLNLHNLHILNYSSVLQAPYSNQSVHPSLLVQKMFSLSFAQFGSYFTNMVLFGKECVIIFNKVSYYLKANLWKIKVWVIFYLPLAWPYLANTYKEILWVYYINRVYSDWEPIM